MDLRVDAGEFQKNIVSDATKAGDAAGRYKTEGNPYGAADRWCPAYMQEVVDETYRQMLDDISFGRNTTRTPSRRCTATGAC